MLLSVMPAFSLTAYAGIVEEGNLTDTITYKIDQNGFLYIEGNGTIDDYSTVTIFGGKKSPFYENTNIQVVVINEGITNISAALFYKCSNIRYVTVPTSVTNIECSPSGLLKTSAFYGCDSLININVLEGNPNYSSQDGILFSNDKTELLLYGAGRPAPTYDLEETVSTIGNRAFYGASNLLSVNLNNGKLNSIGSSAFYNCSNLAEISIPDSVVSIASSAFSGCSGINGNVEIPKSVEEISSSAFYNCTGISDITIINSNCNIYDGENTFPSTTAIKACSGSTAEKYATTYSRTFNSIGHHYEEIERVEPESFTINGYSKSVCSVCGNEKTEPVVVFKTDNDGTRFASNEYILPVAKSFVYNNKLYARFDKPIASFTGIFSTCFKFGELTDQNTLDLYRSLVVDGTRTWYILGGQRSNNDWVHQYSGGKIDASLLQWSSGEPNNDGGSENQIALTRTNGLLNDSSASFNTTAMGFIACTDLSSLSANASCYYLTNKYIFYKEEIPQSYAKIICEAKGGHLVTISNSGENNAVTSLANGVYTTLGGVRNTSGNFEWVTGETFNYTNWASGEPNNATAYGGGQYYMQLYPAGTWDDCNDLDSTKGAETQAFICEYEPTSLTVQIDQDNTHSVADSEIHILANYPDGTSNDITDIASFTKTYLNGCCEVSASATKPNGEVIKVTEDIEVEGEHTYVQQTVTNATCTKEGRIANICSICKSRYDDIIPATGHSYTVSKRVEPTCTESGYVQFTCSICGDKYRETLDALGHAFDGEAETVEATCATDGKITYTCSRCGETQVETIESQGHQYEISETVEATCTLSGFKTYICSVCGDTYNETTEAATGHSYISNTVTPTCTERGYTKYTCSTCSVSYQSNYTNALGHDFESYVFNNDATDLFDGTETSQCTRCDTTDTRNVETTTVYSEGISAVTGSEISVPVRIKNNSGTMGFALEFEYDSTVLTPVSVEKGSLITSGLDDNLQGDAIPGKFKTVWYGTENLTDNGILMYLNFTVSDRASGETTIGVDYSQEDTFNEDFEDVELSCEDICISISNTNSSTWYQGALTPTTGEVTAGSTFCMAINTEGSNGNLIAAAHIISYDNSAFSFLGYADNNQHLVPTSAVDSTGEITLMTSNGRMYNSRTPAEDFETLGIMYLVFKANDYAASGDYAFDYTVIDVSGVDEVSASGCTVTINASATSEIANIYIENGLSGEYTDIVTVPVYISNNKGVMGYMINFEYNPDELEIVLAQRGSSFPGNFNDTIGVDEDGAFSVLWNGTDNIAVDGVLMNLSFRVLTDEDVISPITITYSQDDTFNNDYDDVVFNCIDGMIHLNEEESHDFYDEVIAPTPNSKGYTRHTCINCGYSYIDNETDYDNDMSALIAALDKVTSYDAEDYSAASYEALQAIYAQYLDYPNKSIPQTTIDAATVDILTAIANLVPYLFLTVKAENGTVTVNDYEVASKYSLLFGDSITMNAVPAEGYVFDGWYETVTKRIRSTEATMTFKITSNTSFEARFIKEQSATLSFENNSGWIAAKIDKTVSEWGTIESIEDLLPNVPYKFGYTNGRWVYDEAAVLQSLRNGENVVVTPEYDATDFEHPMIPTPLGDEPALDLYYQLDADNNIGSFTMAAGFPTDCQVESIGIAFYYKSASQFNPVNYDLTINNQLTTSKFAASNEDGVYTVDVKKFINKYNWAVRGYVTYYDAGGNLKTAYTNQINIVNREEV